MNVKQLSQAHSRYPSVLQKYLGDRAPAAVTIIGNLDLLVNRMMALFCSVKCPGKLILQTHDLAHALRRMEVPVIGGFHSPVERECLTILLRGAQPVVLCPARSIERMRIRAEYKQPLADGRLLILSPYVEKPHRSTVRTALYRNQVVAALAERVFVSYAEPRSKTEQFCRALISWGKPLFTFQSEADANLIALGAIPLTLDRMSEWM